VSSFAFGLLFGKATAFPVGVQSFVVLNQGMAGFLLSSGTRLGPWTASTTEAARALLIRELARGKRGRTEVMAPENGQSHRLLAGLGFTGAPDRLRMELGTSSRVAGFETYGLSPYLLT
jgi:hypothetical protein